MLIANRVKEKNTKNGLYKKDYKLYANKITNIKENFIKSVMVNDYIFINLVGLSIYAFVVGLAFLSTRYIINFYLN